MRWPGPSLPVSWCLLPQVDDLKAKLAIQEAELKQKNENADKLIQVVGVETEKVSKEKAIADEEEIKVEVINKVGRRGLQVGPPGWSRQRTCVPKPTWGPQMGRRLSPREMLQSEGPSHGGSTPGAGRSTGSQAWAPPCESGLHVDKAGTLRLGRQRRSLARRLAAPQPSEGPGSQPGQLPAGGPCHRWLDFSSPLPACI